MAVSHTVLCFHYLSVQRTTTAARLTLDPTLPAAPSSHLADIHTYRIFCFFASSFLFVACWFAVAQLCCCSRLLLLLLLLLWWYFVLLLVVMVRKKASSASNAANPAPLVRVVAPLTHGRSSCADSVFVGQVQAYTRHTMIRSCRHSSS